MTSVSKFEWYLESDSSQSEEELEVSGANEEEFERSETEVKRSKTNEEVERSETEVSEKTNEEKPKKVKKEKSIESKPKKEIGQDRQCKFILISGRTKGQRCKTKSNVGKDFCSKHLKLQNK